MFSNQSAVPMPKPPLSSSASETRQPFRVASHPWRSYPVAYVGRDLYDNLGACSQSASSSHVVADTQGGDALDVFPEPRPGPVESVLRASSGPPTRPLYTHVYPPAPYAHRPRATPLPYGWAQHYPGRGADRGEYYQVDGCQAAPSYSFDAAHPAMFCPHHRDEDMEHVHHGDRTYGQEGREHAAEESHVSKERKEHKMAEMVTTKPAHCEYTGCLKSPKYGAKDGPLRFCQSHKRAGMYTNRNGNILVATRDGNAFRLPASPSAGTSTTPSDTPSERAARSSPQAATYLEHFVSLPLQEVRTPSVSTGKLPPLYRKLCEVPGCQVQPSYGPSGTTRPRFCAVHKKKGMVGLKNRPCLFPGCVTRPHYGLSRGRPMYCATHKKNDMVHLLKEAKTLEKKDTARGNGESQEECAKTKGGASAAGEKARRSKASGTQREKGGRRDGADKRQQRRGWQGAVKCFKQKLAVAGKGKKGTRSEVADSLTSRSRELPSSPCSSSSRPASPLPEEGPAAASTKAKKTLTKPPPAQPVQAQTPQSSRMAETSGMAPSAEIKLLQQARESARAEAEASGSGRRARAPSRRFLEAAGMVKIEGAQWMTKEIKEAEAKRVKDLREQRKQYKAAGLRSGEVLEACSVTATNVGDALNGNSGGRGGVEQTGAEGLLEDKQQWRKITPEEILQQAGGRHSLARAASNVGKATAGTQGKGTVTPARTANESVNKRKGVPSITKQKTTTSSRTAGVDSSRKPKRSRQSKHQDGKKGHGTHRAPAKQNGAKQAARGLKGGEGLEGENGEEGTVLTTTCEFRSCRKPATFGVNGAVRYCKAHRLFGMHEINGDN